MDTISKTRKKREALAVQELGEKLVKLRDDQLKNMDLPGQIFDAVMMAKKIKQHGALNRQMQYIGVLMRKIDTAPIQEAVRNIEAGYQRQVDLLKKAEGWRDELIRGNDHLLAAIAQGDTDRHQLTELIQKAREELTKKSAPHAAYRALFRYLHKVAERDGRMPTRDSSF